MVKHKKNGAEWGAYVLLFLLALLGGFIVGTVVGELVLCEAIRGQGKDGETPIVEITTIEIPYIDLTEGPSQAYWGLHKGDCEVQIEIDYEKRYLKNITWK